MSKTNDKSPKPASKAAEKKNTVPPAKKKTAEKKKTAPKTTSPKRTKAAPTPPKSWFRKTIAQRTVAIKTAPWRSVLAWGTVLLLLVAAGVFKFCMVGYSFSALVCLGIAGVVLFYTLMPKIKKKYPVFGRTATYIFTVLLCVGILAAGITEAVIIHASFGTPGGDAPYLVVLGAKVRRDGPSLSLQNRIDAAYDYLTAHPDTVAVVSGGQGPDEHISEAKCMFDHLTAMGIAPERVWMEDKATSTWENLNFSLDLIEEKTGRRPEKLGVLSSEYHLYRASLFTKECGVDFVGVPARTTNPLLMVNYFMREMAGVWHYFVFGGQYGD